MVPLCEDSQEHAENEDTRPIPPSLRMGHLGELGTRRPGCDQPTAETAIEVKATASASANSFLD